MARDPELDLYANDLQQQIRLDADVDGAEQMRAEVFTERMIEVLQEAGELEDAQPCFYRNKNHGVEVHGYGIDDGDTLNLVVSLFRGESPPGSMPRSEAATLFRRLTAFWERCRDREYHAQLEESSEASDMALHIHQAAPDIRRLRLFLVTDARNVGTERLDVSDVDGLEVRRSVWDIERLFRLETSGQAKEPIEIDLVERFGAALPCLDAGVGATAKDYSAMLAVFPGRWIADIYNEYGPRLLELNVRSFLQATGKVNRGIRDTLRDQPERFLAYNNGISATASEVRTDRLLDGGLAITRIKDLQIVNGGQTTASIHRALLAKVDLEHVGVQAKITVVPPEQLEEIVPLISRYANSQNKVNEADLTSNDPFHLEIEKLSRTVWSPVTEGAPQTRWFYERARGQYADAHARERTPSRQRQFKVVHPTSQKFTKTDVAKYENAWNQRPHVVSLGAQKSFTLFMATLKERPIQVDQAYFQSLVAKAILWKSCERIVTAQRFGGYRANLVAYAIAKLSQATSLQVDLEGIWERQATTAALDDAMETLSGLAWQAIVEDAPAGQNITEWAKKEACWHGMRSKPWAVPSQLEAQLRTVAPSGATGPIGSAEDPDVGRCAAVGDGGWYAIANWGRETDNLASWQRSIAMSIAKRIGRGQPPTPKQAAQGTRILDEVARLGFDPRAAA